MSESQRLERLSLSGFRNLEPTVLEPGARFNVVYGDNGAGKSSLLEAIAYIASLHSFRDAGKEDLIQLGQEEARLDASLSRRPLSHEVRIVLSRHAPRRVSLDGKRPASMSSYYGSVQRVLFHPGEVDFAVGAPEARRQLLDRLLEQLDVSYAPLMGEYVKALRSRNRLLKSEHADARSIRAYDALLAKSGARIGKARLELVASLKPRVEAQFAAITEHALPLELSYEPRHEPDEAVLLRELEKSFDKDRARGFTGVGPHGDDLVARLRKSLAKHHASQGQHRALVLALKVAEVDELAARTGRLPLVLLDDVSSELDRARNRRFFGVLSQLGAQVFLTTTHREYILLDEHRRDWHVVAGRVHPE